MTEAQVSREETQGPAVVLRIFYGGAGNLLARHLHLLAPTQGKITAK